MALRQDARHPATATMSLAPGLGQAGDSSIERWFAGAGTPVPLDLARSGAPARTVAELLALAGPADVDEYLGMSLDYGPGPGSERLRAAVSAVTGAPADAVVATNGAVEALLLACAACVRYRPAIAVATPAYEGLYRAVEAAGGRPHGVGVWEPGAAGLDLSRLAALDLERYGAVVVNSPHNPTGLRADPGELADLVGRCQRAGAALILDQVAVGTLDPAAPPVLPELAGGGPVLLVGDVSKAFGLGGLRIGWCVTTSERYQARVTARRDLTTLATSAPGQHLAAIALENRGRLGVAPLARTNLAYLEEWLQRLPGAGWSAPADGLVAFPRLPLPEPSRLFAERVRATRGLAVTPGAFFGHDDHLRLGVGLATAAFREGLGRLAEAISGGRRG
jgi:aspartate/methionine/tyrosine aminotransferase